jgi:hypothetical protein
MTDKTYTAEQFIAEADFAELRGDGSHTASMLRYAATLRQPSSQAGAVDEGFGDRLCHILFPNEEFAEILNGQQVRDALQAALARPASSEPAIGEAVGYLIRWDSDKQEYRGKETLSTSRCHEDDGCSLPVYLHPAEPVKVADGYVLVPREPTEAMWKAAIKASCEAEEVYDDNRPAGVWERFGLRKNRIAHVYAAMLAATPGADGEVES